MWLLTGRRDEWLRTSYLDAVRGVGASLVRTCRAGGARRAYAGELSSSDAGSLDAKMEHLACFAPGMLALGVMRGAARDNATAAAHTSLATELLEACWALYEKVCGHDVVC